MSRQTHRANSTQTNKNKAGHANITRVVLPTTSECGYYPINYFQLGLFILCCRISVFYTRGSWFVQIMNILRVGGQYPSKPPSFLRKYQYIQQFVSSKKILNELIRKHRAITLLGTLLKKINTQNLTKSSGTFKSQMAPAVVGTLQFFSTGHTMPWRQKPEHCPNHSFPQFKQEVKVSREGD